MSGPSLLPADRRRGRPGVRSAERSELALDGFYDDWHPQSSGFAEIDPQILLI